MVTMLRIAVCCVLLVAAVQAYTFRFDNAKLPPYSHEGYRPMPHFRIGIFDLQSAPAKATARALLPRVEFDFTLNGTDVGQVFVYRVETTEWITFNANTTAHPCMDNGQSSGVALEPRMQDTFAQSGMPDGAGRVRAVGSYHVQTTGLYVVNVNTCRYLWRSLSTGAVRDTPPLHGNTSDYQRFLDPGNDRTTISGRILVMNPYGHLPGQAFGFLPGYSILWVVSICCMLALCIGFFRIGPRRLLPIHWCFFTAFILNLFAFLFIIAYLGGMNERDRDVTGVYIFAYLLSRVKDLMTRWVVFLVSCGYGFKVTSLRPWYWLGAGFYSVVFMIIGLATVIDNEMNGRRVTATAAITTLDTGRTSIALIVLDALLSVFALVVYGILVYRTLAKLKREEDEPKRMPIIGTLICVMLYALSGLIDLIATADNAMNHSSTQERNWENWWMMGAWMDGSYTILMIPMLVVWYPKRDSVFLRASTYGDDGNYNGVAHMADTEMGSPGPARARPANAAEQRNQYAAVQYDDDESPPPERGAPGAYRA